METKGNHKETKGNHKETKGNHTETKGNHNVAPNSNIGVTPASKKHQETIRKPKETIRNPKEIFVKHQKSVSIKILNPLWILISNSFIRYSRICQKKIENNSTISKGRRDRFVVDSDNQFIYPIFTDLSKEN